MEIFCLGFGENHIKRTCMVCKHFSVTSLKRNMQIFQWCFTTLIIIESIVAEDKFDKLISGHGILADELLTAINDLSLNSETIDDQVILYDAPPSEDENKQDDDNVKGSTGNEEPQLQILLSSNFNNQNVQTTSRPVETKGNRIPKQTNASIQQQQHLDFTSNPIYKPVQKPSHGYLPELQPQSKPSISSYQPQTVIPASEPRIISGDTYISKERPDPIEVPILGILKPNKYLEPNPVSQSVPFPRSGLIQIPPPVLVPIVVPISQVNPAIFPLHYIRNKKSQ